jgi:predicted ABC-type ATPase
MVRTGAPIGAANIGALRQISQQIVAFIDSGTTFIAEPILANRAYRKHALSAHAVRFDVRVFFIGLPTVQDAIDRVALRVAKGGHDVPIADIRRRWPMAHANLAWFAQHAAAVDVFDNAASGQPPRLVAFARRGSVTIMDAVALPDVTASLRPLAVTP